ncbi:DUF397 domain-containing protein [Streptomyces sp. ML-6]|uniref:DUF397 domain-containing protein n=1 Tax=Streptomyces sp. ML-6 TaxID=2982693 RepID=UPI0024C04CCB|nr:DUF397 domain-containing protein [Streptomyces sp. ML-6]MDK0521463.1 DUF397 domain-containing protein [Streptomyces sp. ML-6]
MTTGSPHWFKSSFSENGGQCVEVAANLVTSRGIIPMRDSKNPHGPTLNTSPTSFVAGVKAGEFGTT